MFGSAKFCPTHAVRGLSLLVALLFACAPAGSGEDRAPSFEDAGTSNDAGTSTADAGTSDAGGSDAGDSDVTGDAGAPPDADGGPVGPAPTYAPGRVTAHRLNRAEYENSVGDLLGIRVDVADTLPPDDLGYGFDNNADVLSLSVLHLERYEALAGELIERALNPPRAYMVDEVIPAQDAEATVGGDVPGGWNLWSNGSLSVPVSLEAGGLYEIGFEGWAEQAGDELARATAEIDGLLVHSWDVSAEGGRAERYSHEVELPRGSFNLGIGFANDFYEPSVPLDRNLIVERIFVRGPTNVDVSESSSRERLLVCEPSSDTDRACAEQVVEAFASRAWRRPAEASSIERLMTLFDLGASQGLSFDEAVSLPLVATLVSPRFLYRTVPSGAEARLLDGYEVASRLSYFLWSSTPDEELLRLAEAGELGTPEAVAAQVERMLEDERSVALVDNFAGQWLYIRDVANVFPDGGVFPDFDEALRASMAEEMRLFFETFLREDRSMLELVTADDTFVDARLAEHYDIDGMSGDGFARVSLEGLPRRGVLGQAGLLTVTSNPTRTSVVRRGKWVMEQLLCSSPPEPPPGVEGLPDQAEVGGTLREILEQHRADPVCASCHEVMDEIGFALEGFDGIGAVRAFDNGFPIDNVGRFPDGTTFHGATELADVIAADERFAHCMVEQLTTYALGRATAFQDADQLDAIAATFAAEGYRFAALARAVATSDVFRYVGPAEEAP